MTTKIDDGGPAFSVPIAAHDSGDTVPAFDWGMSLRDWFAGHALAGLMAATAHPESGGPSHSYGGYDGLARMAYAFADAMVLARVGPAADIELRDITCVAECTPTAVDAWEKAPWSR